MDKSRLEWLKLESRNWVSKGIINSQQADEICRSYSADNFQTENKSNSILIVVGACLLAASIVLILSNNWHKLSSLQQTMLAIGVLLVSQLMNAIAIYREKKWESYREAIAIFHVGAVFASLGLIARIYSIDGHQSTYLLICLLLILPVAYIMRSIGIATIYMLGCAWWVSWERFNNPWSFNIVWLLLLAILPWHYLFVKNSVVKLRGEFILRWSIPISLYIAFYQTVATNYHNLELLLWSFFVGMLLLIVDYLARYKEHLGALKTSSKFLVFVILLFAGFEDYWRYMLKANANEYYVLYFFVLIFAILLYKGWKVQDNVGKGLGVAPVVLGIVLVFFKLGISAITASSLVNIYVLLLAAYITRAGLQIRSIYVSNMGLCMLLVLALLRFFDSSFSYLARGGIFAIVGVLVISLNFWLMRKSKEKHSQEQEYFTREEDPHE